MPVNRELVERKINLILGDLERLNKLAGLSPEQYLSDERNEVEYFDSFIRIEPDRMKRFAGLSGLRNRIAHEYNDFDAELIYQSMKEIAADLPEYLRAIQKYLG